MANRRNAIIKIRQDKKRTPHNRSTRAEIQTLIRKFAHACEAKQLDNAKDACRVLYSKLDKALKKGTLKENTVNRQKSRITKRLNLIPS
jgi:small subunit ribosomal protein S20